MEAERLIVRPDGLVLLIQFVQQILLALQAGIGDHVENMAAHEIVPAFREFSGHIFGIFQALFPAFAELAEFIGGGLSLEIFQVHDRTIFEV